jgi:hypothetical protein
VGTRLAVGNVAVLQLGDRRELVDLGRKESQAIATGPW